MVKSYRNSLREDPCRLKHPWYEYYTMWTAVISLQSSSKMKKDLTEIVRAYDRFRNNLIRNKQSLYTK